MHAGNVTVEMFRQNAAFRTPRGRAASIDSGVSIYGRVLLAVMSLKVNGQCSTFRAPNGMVVTNVDAKVRDLLVAERTLP
jgi:hypothetical protein